MRRLVKFMTNACKKLAFFGLNEKSRESGTQSAVRGNVVETVPFTATQAQNLRSEILCVRALFVQRTTCCGRSFGVHAHLSPKENPHGKWQNSRFQYR
ncbi:hypothetical protein EMIT0P2_50264 [Pseudomonas sp. IT-P2]